MRKYNMKASELFNNEPVLKVLVYGDSGTGKTTWAAQAPHPLILLTEKQGLPSIFVANPDAEVAIVQTYGQVLAALDRLKGATPVVLDDGQKALRVAGKSSDIIVQTLVIDGLTQVSELCRQSMTSSKIDDTTLQEWGRVKRAVNRLCGSLRNIRCNVICTALSSDMDVEGERRTLPLMNPNSLRFEVAQYFSACAFSHKRGPRQYSLAWSLGARWITKEPPTLQTFPSTIMPGVRDGVGTLGSMLRYLYPDVEGVAYGTLDNASKLTTTTTQGEQGL
jgi:hypothetical protein